LNDSPSASATAEPTIGPVSSNPQAASACERAERSFRNASTTIAYRDFDQANKLDPSLPLAQLRVALIDFQDAPSYAREHLQKALQLRERLSGPDRALLDGAEAWMVRDDPSDAIRKLQQGVEQYPRDALLRVYLAALQAKAGALQGALKTVDEAIAIEPALAMAWVRKGKLHLLLGELEAAAAAYDQCLKIAPTATDCLEERMGLRSRAGQCEQALQDAQSVVNADPKSDSGYYLKASLLAGMERPRETVFEVLKQRWDRIEDASDRKQTELTDRISYEQMQGKFADSLRLVAAWKESVAKAPDLIDHAGPATSLCELNLEMGRANAAAGAAADFLQKMDAYSPVQRNQDVSLIFVESLYRAGKLSRKQFDVRRSTWFKNPQLLWLHGYAMTARTAEEAREALSALRSPADIPSWHARSIATDLAVGKVYALAGRSSEALKYLKAAAGACDVLSDPMAHTQAHWYLGMALADTGDSAGACSAWQVVIRRWGDAPSQSVTAAQARKSAKAAGCKQEPL
jgi:serine/threonine-protein kinase